MSRFESITIREVESSDLETFYEHQLDPLARYFFTFRDVDHIDRQVRQLGAEGCRKIIATRLDKA